MPKRFDDQIITDWTKLADKYLTPHNYTRGDIKTGRDAWAVAHRCGITAIAYLARDVTDAHIKTALARVFPNAVFKDKYHY